MKFIFGLYGQSKMTGMDWVKGSAENADARFFYYTNHLFLEGFPAFFSVNAEACGKLKLGTNCGKMTQFCLYNLTRESCHELSSNKVSL